MGFYFKHFSAGEGSYPPLWDLRELLAEAMCAILGPSDICIVHPLLWAELGARWT